MYQHIIIFILIVFLILFNRKRKLEAFNDRYGRSCLICSCKNINQCTECADCGYCILDNGEAKCIPGDTYGPFDPHIKCSVWYNNNPFSRVNWNAKLKPDPPFSLCRY